MTMIVLVAVLIGLTGATVSRADILPRVGILPFRVHSLKPMDHLKEGLQQDVAKHMKEMGFDVVPPVEINKHPMAFLPMFEVRDLQTIGRDVGARWIVSGSFTQVGRKISLDIKGVDAQGEKPSFSVFIVEDDMERLPQAAQRVATGVYNQVAGLSRSTTSRFAGTSGSRRRPSGPSFRAGKGTSSIRMPWTGTCVPFTRWDTSRT